MQIFTFIVQFLLCAVNAFLFYLLEKYRRMFTEQHNHFIEMNELVNKYKDLYEKQKDNNRTIVIQKQYEGKNDKKMD